MTGPEPAAEPFFFRVYDALVRLCEANDHQSDRMQWDNFWMSDGNEYRFIGALGFGGKFFRSRSSWWVSCYPEDETPMRKLRIGETNRALDVLRLQWLDDPVGVLEA